MRAKPRAVLLGGSGLIGRALARTLGRGGAFEPHIVDVRPPRLDGVRYDRVDVLRGDLRRVFDGADAVIHLVAQVDPPRPGAREAMRRLHVEGTRRALAAAVAAGVRRFVLCSSAVVYGARPDNPVPLREDAPVRPNPDFPYAVDKAAQEALVREEAGRLEVAIARPAIVYGHEARSYLTEVLRRAPGVLPALDGHRPPLQFVHVDDVASALAALAERSVLGAFNVCSVDWLPFEEVARAAGLRVVPVPRRWVAPLLDIGAHILPAWARAPAYILDYLAHPFVLSGERLAQEIGFEPTRTSAEALEAMLQGRGRGRGGLGGRSFSG